MCWSRMSSVTDKYTVSQSYTSTSSQRSCVATSHDLKTRYISSFLHITFSDFSIVGLLLSTTSYTNMYIIYTVVIATSTPCCHKINNRTDLLSPSIIRKSWVFLLLQAPVSPHHSAGPKVTLQRNEMIKNIYYQSYCTAMILVLSLYKFSFKVISRLMS